VLENGGWAGIIHDAVKDVAEEVLVCDPTRNALIAQADDSDDRCDAKRLTLLARTNALHAIYIPAEPFRTLRSLVNYESCQTNMLIALMLRLKAFCRKHGVPYQGKSIYRHKGRETVIARFPTGGARFQITSLFRLLNGIRQERLVLRRELRRLSRTIPAIKRLQTVPGIGPVVGRVLAAWIAEPTRFKSRSALAAYAGLGLKRDVSNWRPGKEHASRRGQREIKRVLFLAARAVIRSGNNALAQRYQARRAAGWEDGKAIRDLARKILFASCQVWKTKQEYDNGRINVPCPVVR
jgi:transposase